MARMRARRGRRGTWKLPDWLIEAETEPWRQDWLRLTPAQRMLRCWRMRRMLKDPGAAHDALSLPRL